MIGDNVKRHDYTSLRFTVTRVMSRITNHEHYIAHTQ